MLTKAYTKLKLSHENLILLDKESFFEFFSALLEPKTSKI